MSHLPLLVFQNLGDSEREIVVSKTRKSECRVCHKPLPFLARRSSPNLPIRTVCEDCATQPIIFEMTITDLYPQEMSYRALLKNNVSVKVFKNYQSLIGTFKQMQFFFSSSQEKVPDTHLIQHDDSFILRVKAKYLMPNFTCSLSGKKAWKQLPKETRVNLKNKRIDQANKQFSCCIPILMAEESMTIEQLVAEEIFDRHHKLAFARLIEVFLESPNLTVSQFYPSDLVFFIDTFYFLPFKHGSKKKKHPLEMLANMCKGINREYFQEQHDIINDLFLDILVKRNARKTRENTERNIQEIERELMRLSGKCVLDDHLEPPNKKEK